GREGMKQAISVLLTLLVALSLCSAEETAFNGVKLADAKGKQADARLIFSDNDQHLVVQVADRDFVIVPYQFSDSGIRCNGGLYTGFQLPKLRRSGLPYAQTFTNEGARNILLASLKANGRFYVLIAFEGTQPKLHSMYPFANWFAQSLE